MKIGCNLKKNAQRNEEKEIENKNLEEKISTEK